MQLTVFGIEVDVHGDYRRGPILAVCAEGASAARLVDACEQVFGSGSPAVASDRAELRRHARVTRRVTCEEALALADRMDGQPEGEQLRERAEAVRGRAVLRRFMGGRPLAEVAAALRLSEPDCERLLREALEAYL